MEIQRAVLSIDGNCGCALLGPNLQEGEVEFVEIDYRGFEPWSAEGCKAETKACFLALGALRKRLGIPITYAWYPRRPGSAGA